jgi:hypothetical protein
MKLTIVTPGAALLLCLALKSLPVSAQMETGKNQAAFTLSPSLQALEGDWYSASPSVCKGGPSEPEGGGLISFRGSHLMGYETNCKIVGSKASGRFLALRMICSSEGTESRSSEVIEFLGDHKIRRSFQDGRKTYLLTLNRCPVSEGVGPTRGTDKDAGQRTEPATTLIELWYDANSRCRGGSGDSPLTEAACSERERYGSRLDALGRCYGKQGQIGAEMKWHVCSADSFRDAH